MTKRALITGASEGIGRAVAKRLARESYSLTLVARNRERLESLLEELPSHEHKIIITDLSRSEDILKLAEHLLQEPYQLLINNAGSGYHGTFSKISMEQLLPMFRLNCEAVFILSHSFLKHAKAGDALVNVSSSLAFLPLPSSATYCATKSFVTALSESVWYEEKKRNIFVMNLCPGLTKTEFFERAGGTRERPPEFMFQSAEAVVEELYSALQKRCKPTLIPGLRNRIALFFIRVLSRKTLVRILGISR
jgi:short-subunit dehydrogenase